MLSGLLWSCSKLNLSLHWRYQLQYRQHLVRNLTYKGSSQRYPHQGRALTLLEKPSSRINSKPIQHDAKLRIRKNIGFGRPFQWTYFRRNEEKTSSKSSGLPFINSKTSYCFEGNSFLIQSSMKVEINLKCEIATK